MKNTDSGILSKFDEIYQRIVDRTAPAMKYVAGRNFDKSYQNYQQEPRYVQNDFYSHEQTN